MRCPHCHTELNGMPSKCPYCTGDIEYGSREKGETWQMTKAGAIAGAIGFPAIRIYNAGWDMSIGDWFYGIFGGAIAGAVLFFLMVIYQPNKK